MESDNIFQDSYYRSSVIKSNFYILAFLLKKNIPFTIICHTDVVSFNPEVPKSIIEFEESTVFKIANYTLENAKLNNISLTIETGFGEENFASVLTIPLEAISHILYEKDLLAINYYKPEKRKDSMDILLSNPENLKLLKNKFKK